MLKRLGTVLHQARNGYIVVKLDLEDSKLPPLNVPVFDEEMNKVGTLLDIIGPIKDPYAVVKPATKETRIEKGSKLYYRPPKPRKKPQRRASRRKIGQKGARPIQRARKEAPRRKASLKQPRKRGRARRGEKKGRGARK
ncbi:hypothetical protein PYJP_19550 [Pyrofollis japonicus]|uniref:H/ACA ribonucleoprotein complex subunit GAR1 n=1 Tax=Pyrofollis japonicus TaxID=3060460 RepID=UPI00295A862F|nr:Gar1/Naf1 family protein [Pyrofollis japonicus]BEP18603.1 hypothetical protein PYJP_19550 [Pyrofollis japonicus]